MQELLWQIILTIGLYLLNPILIIGIIIVIRLGYTRVKKERNHFGVRLIPEQTEFKRLISESWMYGLGLSILNIGLVLSVDLDWLIFFYLISFVALITCNFKLTSPIYFMAITYCVMYVLFIFEVNIPYIAWNLEDFKLLEQPPMPLIMIIGLLLFIEGMLIRGFSTRYMTPIFVETNRGRRGVAFKAKQLWLLPVLFVVPADWVTGIFPNWPVFQIGNTTDFVCLPVPIVIGYSQITRSIYPEQLLPQMSRRIILLSMTVLAMTVLALWMPIFSFIALFIGAIGRIALSIYTSRRDRNNRMLIVPQEKGIVIAAVHPKSPAEAMGLICGECILAVNGEEIYNEKEFYVAIQRDVQYCYLQVRDRQGETRIVQEEIGENDHYLLGIVPLV